MVDALWHHRGERRPAFAETPGEDQESVWDYPRPPRIVDDHRRVMVYAAGRVLADTRDALRVCETASPPTFYLPLADIARDRLVEVPGSSHCEWKGAACYYALADDPRREPVAWGYPELRPAYARLRDHLGFYPGRVACFVGAERVRPQPGAFYGGWITADVVGPFKGAPGTAHW